MADTFNADFGVVSGFGLNVFLRKGSEIFRTYFTTGRGVETLGTTWTLLDLTPRGRQETWEDAPQGTPQSEPYAWWRLHDEYPESPPLTRATKENTMPMTQKVSTCLWFDREAEEAAEYYVSLFDNSRVVSIARYGKDAGMPEGLALFVVFELDGATVNALNGGPQFPHSEAASMFVRCKTQDEIDRLWERLTQGGSPGVCGWLKDRYGLSWQIVPEVIERLLTDPDADVRARVMAAVMGMTKLDIAALEAARAG